MEYVRELLRILAALDDEGVAYVLIGGAALNVHGLVRATEDVDLLIAPSPENVERLKRALRSVWNDPDIDQISAEDLCGAYPVVRYGPPEGSLYLDILARIGTAVQYEDLEWERVELEGTVVRVATPRMLYRLKKDTVRPIDRADAEAIRQAFQLKDDGDAG